MTYPPLLPATPADLPRATLLAQALGLPLLEPQDPRQITHYKLVLLVDEAGLALQPCGKKAPGAVRVDFTSPALLHRITHGGGKGQMIAKAVGLHKIKHPTVLDATAGLGRDAFVLAALGAQVSLCERHPIIYAMLEDALRRAAGHPLAGEVVARMTLVGRDASVFLHESGPFDVIYLDPMFPARDKSAAVKKDMQLFHQLIGEDVDNDLLLSAALVKATHRVVVKRPRHAPPLQDKKPDFMLEGQANRFDVYRGSADLRK